MSKRDYYEVLGVGKDASADEIKKAFRRAAVKHHPDQGGDEEKFKELNEAYEVLKDSGKRQRYDQFGHAGVGSSAASDGGNPFAGFGGFGGNAQEMHFDFGDLGLGDIFGEFFGGGGRSRGGPKRGQDVETAIELTFEEAVFGVEKDLKIRLHDTCEHCKGTRAEPGHELKTCEVCKGAGQVVQGIRTPFGVINQQMACKNCEGQGKVPEKICSVCRGRGVKDTEQKIRIKIPAGIDDGATIRLHQRGEAIAGGQKGDLYVHLRVKSHKKFTRDGNLILSDEKVSMVDAALGTEIDVETVDGPIKMKIPAGTQSGTDFKLSGHGVGLGSTDKRGAHIVTIIVETPTKLSKKQKELLESFRGAKSSGLFGL